MTSFYNAYNELRLESIQNGISKALKSLIHRIVNKIISVERLEIVLLKRENLLPINLEKYSSVSSRLATAEDLLEISKDDKWEITDELREAFLKGDSCLLSFVDGKLAGYTWVHTRGHPQLIDGLKISIPNKFGYNYAGFTLPEFRGFGLQPYRHHQILNRSEWIDKEGMYGYVVSTNWSSKKGQAKSGYQRLGELTILGTGNKMKCFFSKELKKLGIQRLDG